jgi:hypothetical protein
MVVEDRPQRDAVAAHVGVREARQREPHLREAAHDAATRARHFGRVRPLAELVEQALGRVLEDHGLGEHAPQRGPLVDGDGFRDAVGARKEHDARC